MSFRDLKRQARADLHRAMRVSALYYPTGSPSDTPVPVSVRVAYGFRPVGNDVGTDYRFAEMQEQIPKLLFMVEEQTPASKAVVSISATEVYRLDVILPIDFISISANVVKASDAQAALFAYPGSEAWPLTLWS